MAIRDWRLNRAKSLTEFLKEESDLFVAVLYRDDIERSMMLRNLKTKLSGAIQDNSNLWTIVLRNRSVIRLVPIQRSQIELKGISISLLLFPDGIEYNVKNQITRELYPQIPRDGGIVGTLRI